MSHDNLTKMLKVATLVSAMLFLAFCVVIVPVVGLKFGILDGVNVFWPWAIMIWIAAIPCLSAFILFWQICTEISKDNSFSEVNATKMKYIAYCAFGDAAYFLLINTVYYFIHYSTVVLYCLAILVCVVAVAFGLAAATLSRLISKAAEMRAENDLTI